MGSLEQLLVDSFGNGFDKRAEDYLNSSFLNNRQTWVNSVVREYIRYNTDPNETISKIAQEHNLNNDQIQRIVEESNINIYLQKYAQTKGNSVRRVVFPLADADKISTRANQHPAERGSAASNEEDSTISKVASVSEKMTFDLGEADKGNFLTSSLSYEPSLWEQGAPEKTAKELVKRRIEDKIRQAKTAHAKELRGLLRKIAYLGDALIYNERAGESAQDTLDKIAADADVYGKPQIPIIKYVREKVASLKEQRMLPNNFNLDLKLSEKTATNEYSLGAHSLLKNAGSNDIVIKVDKLPDGADYSKLVEVAKEIKKELEKNPPKDLKKPIVIEGV